jgi:hypothetical protein
MTVILAQHGDAVAPIAETLQQKNEARTAPPETNNETTKAEDKRRKRRESFLDLLRRALSVPHV